MKNAAPKPQAQVEMLPKAEAIERIAKFSATIRVELAKSEALLKAAVSPDKYTLNFQVNGLKKKINSCKVQIARIKKEPKADTIWSDSFTA